jgi:hypothetical protein
MPAPAEKSDKPSEVTILRFFTAKHLPEHMRTVSELFGGLAQRLVEICPNNAERSVALRKLLESKDAAVRSVLPES